MNKSKDTRTILHEFAKHSERNAKLILSCLENMEDTKDLSMSLEEKRKLIQDIRDLHIKPPV